MWLTDTAENHVGIIKEQWVFCGAIQYDLNPTPSPQKTQKKIKKFLYNQVLLPRIVPSSKWKYSKNNVQAVTGQKLSETRLMQFLVTLQGDPFLSGEKHLKEKSTWHEYFYKDCIINVHYKCISALCSKLEGQFKACMLSTKLWLKAQIC